MKHLLLALSLFPLFGCQDSGTNEGYDAGYNLACGFSWAGGNRLVIDNEFAYHFLAGARECAKEHPERARQVLGLGGEEQSLPARAAYTTTEPAVAEKPKPQDLPPPGPVEMETREATVKAADVPSKTDASSVRAKAPAKPAAASVKRKTPAKTNAPAKAATVAVDGEAPAKPAKDPRKGKPPQKAIAAPVEVRAPAKATKTPGKDDNASVSAPKDQTPPVTAPRGQRTQRKKAASSYESFMGE